jgi:hypothetical protein
MNAKRKRPVWLVLSGLVVMVLLCGACQALYTIYALYRAHGDGVYETPQQGAIANANRWYCGVEKVDIEQAGTNMPDASNPHVWYVIWRVYAHNRAPCNPANPGPPLYDKTYETGGNYYLNARDGWVFMPEGMLPDLVGIWMKVLGLAGPGDPTPAHNN